MQCTWKDGKGGARVYIKQEKMTRHFWITGILLLILCSGMSALYIKNKPNRTRQGAGYQNLRIIEFTDGDRQIHYEIWIQQSELKRKIILWEQVPSRYGPDR